MKFDILHDVAEGCGLDTTGKSVFLASFGTTEGRRWPVNNHSRLLVGTILRPLGCYVDILLLLCGVSATARHATRDYPPTPTPPLPNKHASKIVPYDVVL